MFPTSFPTDEESDSITEALPVLPACEDLCPQYWIAPHIWSCWEKAICESYGKTYGSSSDNWSKLKSLLKDRDDIRIIYADGMATDASENVPSQCSVLYIYVRGVSVDKICRFGVQSFKDMSRPQPANP